MNIRALVLGIGIIGLMSACSSGGSTIPAPSMLITPTPSPAPSGPVSASSVATIGTTAGQSIAAPVVQGYAPTITTPALSVPLAGTVTASTDVPAGIASFSLLRSSNVLGSRQIAAKPANANVLLYLNIVPTATTTASGDIAFSFALPNPPTGTNAYYLAFFDGRTWHTDYITAPGTLTDKGVSFPTVTLPAPVTLIAGNKYAIALYSVPSNATPAPDVLLAPIAAKPPAGSPPLASSLGAKSLVFDPAGPAPVISAVRLFAGIGSVEFPQAVNKTTISYTVYDGIPASIKLPDPPKDGDVQGVLGITPTAPLSFVKGSKVTLKFKPDSGVVPKYDLGLIIGDDAVTTSTQTDDGTTATVSYTLTDDVTFPANQVFYVGFGLQEGDFNNNGTGKDNGGPNKDPNKNSNNSNPNPSNPSGPTVNTGVNPSPTTTPTN